MGLHVYHNSFINQSISDSRVLTGILFSGGVLALTTVSAVSPDFCFNFSLETSHLQHLKITKRMSVKPITAEPP